MALMFDLFILSGLKQLLQLLYSRDGPAFKSYERLFYNGNSDSISKVPPENAAAINKDTPESWPIKKITTAEALSQETEELEDSLDFGNQVIEHI